MTVDKAARRTRLDGLAKCEQAQDLTNPLDAFEPPMSEQLGVVRGTDDAEAPRAAMVGGNLLLDEPGEMPRVLRRALGGPLRFVDAFVAEVDAASGNAPVLEARRLVLAMKLAIDAIAGVTMLAGPNLHARA